MQTFRLVHKIFLAALLSLPICLAHSQESPQVFSLGVVLHLTGDLAMQSAAFREGVELAADQVNQLDEKFRIKIIVEDGNNNPRSSNTAVQKLINHDKVDAVILSSYLDVMASGAILEKRHIPTLVIWDSSPEIENLGEYIFAIGPWTPSSGEEAAGFAAKRLGAKTAAVITSSESWSESVGRFFKDEFIKFGGTVIEEANIPASESDFRAILTRIRTKHPDVVYSPLVFNFIPFFSQIKQYQLSSAIIISSVITDEHISQAPGVLEGIYQTQLLNLQSAANELLAKSYKAKFNRNITMPWYVAVGHDAVKIMHEAVKRGGSNSEGIKRALYSIKNYPGASSSISINERGSSPQFERMHRIRDGKIVLEQDSDPPEALRIGLIAPLTGGVATWGNSVKTAIEIANAEAKYPAELFFQDEETCIPTKALSAFHYLVSDRKVDILITSCLEGAQAIAPLARRSRIPFFISGRSSQEFQASNPNALSWISLLDFEGRAIGQLIKERRLARGSALVWSGYFGVQFAKGIERAIADSKLTFDYNFTEIDQDAIPVAAEVQRLLRNDPDVVFLMMSEPAAAFVVKQLKTYRYKGLIVLQSSMLQTYDPKARAIFDGALQLKFPANSAEFSRLQSIIQAKQGENIADDFVFSYDGFKVLLAEATICKREQPEALETCINSRIRDESWRQGASGSFRYMKDGSTDRPMVFKTITERGFR